MFLLVIVIYSYAIERFRERNGCHHLPSFPLRSMYNEILALSFLRCMLTCVRLQGLDIILKLNYSKLAWL